MPAQPDVPMTAGSNMKAAYDQFLKDMRELGRTKGKGENAQIAAAIQCVERASEGVMNVGNTEEVYDAFLGGESEATGSTNAGTEKKDRGVRISELKQLVKMGGIKTIDAVTLIHNAVKWIAEAKASGQLARKTKVYSAMVDVARAQCKIPEHQLEREECIAAAQPKQGREKEEADHWGAIRDTINKVQAKFGRSDEGDRIMSDVQLKIDDLGGTSADRKRAAKSEQELAKLRGSGAAAPASKKKGKK